MDIQIENHGSIVILNGVTDEGFNWLHDNLQDPQTWGVRGFVVEPRYVQPIIDGAEADGLTVSY